MEGNRGKQTCTYSYVGLIKETLPSVPKLETEHFFFFFEGGRRRREEGLSEFLPPFLSISLLLTLKTSSFPLRPFPLKPKRGHGRYAARTVLYCIRTTCRSTVVLLGILWSMQSVMGEGGCYGN